MDEDAEDLLARALTLPPEQRRLVAYELLATLDDDEAVYDEGWQSEIERRMADDDDAWVPVEAARELFLGASGPALTAPGNGAEGGEVDMLAAYKAALDRIADDDLDFG